MAVHNIITWQEGNFAYLHKNGNHPHTNMGKAALNMLTRTIGAELAEQGRSHACLKSTCRSDRGSQPSTILCKKGLVGWGLDTFRTIVLLFRMGRSQNAPFRDICFLRVHFVLRPLKISSQILHSHRHG